MGKSRRRFAFAVGALALSSTSVVAPAYAQEARQRFAIPAQPMSSALLALGRQAKISIAASRDLTRGKTGNAINGEMSVREALSLLLSGSGLQFTFVNGSAVRISRGSAAARADAQHPPIEVRDGDAGRDEEIVVTGTNIRGAAPVGSALTVYDREQLDRSGVATVEQFMRQVPANFSLLEGDTFLNSGSRTGANGSRGSTVDLRGLGTGSTLVLLEGHRLPSSGTDGSFVDISVIPFSAIERIEILGDGASAIYGADAVAGVANYVLRKDFEGADLSIRYGDTTDGGGREYGGAALFGHRWASGSVLLSASALNQGRLSVEDRDYLPVQDGTFDIAPAQKRYSFFGSLVQDVTPDLQLQASGLYSKRRFEQTSFLGALTDEYGSNRVTSVTGSLRYRISPSLSLNAAADYSTGREIRHAEVFIGSDLVAAYDLPTRSKTFNTQIAINGELFAMSGGAVRFALGSSYRHEKFQFSYGGVDLSRDLISGYGEIIVPLVGEANARPLIEKLEISGAIRHDHYSDAGSSWSPKVGINWVIVPGLSLRGSYAKAFRAPPLGQLAGDTSLYYLLDAPNPAAPDGVTYTLLPSFVVNPDLKPERARTFTVGFDVKPSAIPRATLSASYFNIAYKDRISGPPQDGDIYGLFSQYDILAPFIDLSPDLAMIQDIFANKTVLDLVGGLGPEDVEAYFDGRLRNISSTKASGFDFSLRYEFPTGDQGNLALFGAFQYLLGLKFRATPDAATVERAGTIYNPSKFRAQFGASYFKPDWDASITGYHVAGYENALVTPIQEVRSWTTADAQISFHPRSAAFPSWLQSTSWTLAVQNLFNTKPPSIDVGAGQFSLGFDSTNASARGRFVSLQVRKQF
jgi:outer membrane receptor protein involved in Fe transport